MTYTIKPGGDLGYKVFKDGDKVATIPSRDVHEAIRDAGYQVVDHRTFNDLLDAKRKLETIRNSAACSAGKVINITEIDRIIEHT